MLGSGSSSDTHRGRWGNMTDSHSLEAEYHSDDDFLVVECRTNALDLAASLPMPVLAESREKEEEQSAVAGSGGIGGGTLPPQDTANSATTNGSTTTCSDTEDTGKT